MFKVLAKKFEYHDSVGSLILGRQGAVIHVERRDESKDGIASGAIAPVNADGFVEATEPKTKKRGRPRKKKKTLEPGMRVRYLDKEGEIKEGTYDGQLNSRKARVLVEDGEGFVLVVNSDIEMI